MKSFFSRLNGDNIQASSTKESSFKFWIPPKTNAERSPPKPIPIHPDVAASQGEKRSRPLKSTHLPKIPLHDLPTAPVETQATHFNDMSKHTTRPKLGTSSTSYTQNHPPPSSRTPRPHEHNDTRYQTLSREAHGPVHPTGSHTFHDASSKPHRDGRHESVAPVPREIWLPPTTPVVSRQVVDQTKLHVQGTREKPDRYRESGDEKDRELERRGKDRGRERREREREREWEKAHTREREREERERNRAKERERTLEKEREIARANRDQDRNLEIDQGRDRDKAERDRREQERDLDRDGEKGKSRTKDRSRKESSNLTRGMEKAWDSDVPYDGERPKQDERKARHRDRAVGGVDGRESHKERDRWPEKEPERARDRLGGQIKHRAEATDSEQFAGRVKTPAPDRERRKDLGVGWVSDTHTGHTRKLLRKTSNTLLNQPSRAEEGESSDSSTRPKRVRQVLTKRHRGEEGGSSSKVNHSRQGMPTEPLTSTKSSVVKATTVTILDDAQLPVPPTPQHMPIYLPPKESNAVNSGLPPTIAAPLNVVSTREAEAPPRRETVKYTIPDEPLPHAAENMNMSKPREIDISVVRRPPSRGPPVHPQNPIPQGTRESVYIHKPKHSQPPPLATHDKLQTPGPSLLPEMPHISTQVEGSKEPSRSLERLPDSKPKKEVEVDLAPSVFYKVQHRIPPQSAGAVPNRQPTVSTLHTVTIDPAPPQPNSDPKAHPLLPGWRNNFNGIPPNIPSNQEKIHVATASGIDVDSKIPPSKSSQSRSNGQDSIGIAITRPSTTTGFRQNSAGKNLRHHNISLSRSDAENNIGILIPRPSTATAIKQSSSGPYSHQTSNATSHKLNPLVEEAHSSMFPRPSIPRHDSIPVTNPQPVSEKGSRFPAQPYNMTPIVGPSLSKGHATVLPEDVTGQQDAPGSRRQGRTGAADANIISPPENFTSQASTVLNPIPDNLRNATTTPLTSLNTIAPSTRSTTPPSSFTTPQIQIQRPPTSLSTRNNSVPPALPSAVIVPQIQIHHLITTTSTGNTSGSAHTDHCADASIPRTPGTGTDLDTPDINRLGTANVPPIQVDQPQDFLGSGNRFHRPVHLIPTSTSRMADANDMRPSVNEGALPSHGEDSRFNVLRVGSNQEVTTQTLVNKQMNSDLAQGSPSLGFFNNTFSEVLQSPVVQRSDQDDRLAMKRDGKIVYTVLEADKDDGTNQTINKKTSDSLVNRDAVRNVLPKEQPEVSSVERLITRKDSHIDIHNSKVAFSQISSERSSKSPPTPSQPRIQHPGLAEILSSPFNRNDNNQPPSSSIAHHQPTSSSTVPPKSGLSPKFQGSLDKQRLDDKLVSPKSSPSRQSPSDLLHKEVEQPHESPKRQLQQSATTFSRSAYLENLLSDPHGGDSLSLTPSNVPSLLSHPSNVLHPPHITSSVPDGITRPILESMSHVNNKKAGQSGTSFPEVPISSGGPSQVEELASRRTRPSSVLDSKPLGNSIPHYRAITPLRESTLTSRHQHSTSLPVHLVSSANVPSVDGPLRSATHPPLHRYSASQTKPGYTPLDSQRLAPNITHGASDSEETILMTPSSLARSVMLKPTISRQSVTPSVSSQTARKGTGLFTMFRSKTPAQPPPQPPPQYEIWHPNTSLKTAEPNAAPSRTLAPSFTQVKTSAPTRVPVTSVPIAIERPSQKSKIFTPFRYLTTKRNRAVSLVSVEAQDGTAPSTIVGSPTASMLSQAPFQPPPIRDPMKATEEWRNKEDENHLNGKMRRQRPGVVIDVAEEEHPEGDRRQRPMRTRTRHKSSSKPSKQS